MTGVPLLLVAAPVAVMLRMPEAGIPALLIGLLIGSLLLSLFGRMGAALFWVRGGGRVADFAAGDSGADIWGGGGGCGGGGVSPRPHLLLLGAMLAAALPLCPLAGGAALRGAVE